MHLRHPATGGGAAPAPGGRFLVYLASRRHDRPRELERALLERLRHCHGDRRPQVVRVDAERRPDLVERYRVRALPAVLLLDDGIVRGRVERPEPGEADEAIAGVIPG